jgi:hypothetical protein
MSRIRGFSLLSLTFLSAHVAVAESLIEPALAWSKRPLAFVSNEGQWPPQARFVASLGSVTALLEDRAITMLLRADGGDESHIVRLAFEGASASEPQGIGRRAETQSYFLGRDAARWRRDVPVFAAVEYGELYPCVDLRFREGRGDDGRALIEYDIILEPGADLDHVVVRCEGILGLALDADGALRLETPLGALRQSPPKTWQELPNGVLEPIDCRYRLIDDARYGFDAPDRDLALPMTIDPGLEWAYFLGGASADGAGFGCMAIDSEGYLVLAAETYSVAFPAAPNPENSVHAGGSDIFVAKIDAATGEVVSSTFIGGEGDDLVAALDSRGTDIYLAGSTASADFPVTNDSVYRGVPGDRSTGDGFVIVFNAQIDAPFFSTFLGGAGGEAIVGLAAVFSRFSLIVVTGFTSSQDLPATPGAFQTAHGGGSYDSFVARLCPGCGPTLASQLTYLTYLGGDGDETWPDVGGSDLFFNRVGTGDLIVEGDSSVIVAGQTRSRNFPVTANAFDSSLTGVSDVFVARLVLDATLAPEAQLLYATYLGGSGSRGGIEGEAPSRIRRDPNGGVWIAGWTDSADFPTTTGAFDRSPSTPNDGFITLLELDRAPAEQVRYSTFLNGSGGDLALELDVTPSGLITVGGLTSSPEFPRTAGAFPLDGNRDAADGFLLRLNPDRQLPPAEQLIYANLFGGSGWEEVDALAVLPSGKVAMAISTQSFEFPSALPDVFGYGDFDIFLALVDVPTAHPARLIRGDADSSGAIDITNAISSLAYQFLGGPAPCCLDAIDADDGGTIDITDPVYVLGFLFLGGPRPPAPFPACGPDPTEDNLDCGDTRCCPGA